MSTLAGTRSCPRCAALIEAGATKCRSCGMEVPADGVAVVQPIAEGGTAIQAADAPLALAPGAEPAAPAKGPGVVKWLVPVARSGWAVASGYLALLSCLPLLIIGVLAAFMSDVIPIKALQLGDGQGLDNMHYLIAAEPKPLYGLHGVGAGAGLLAIVTGILTFVHCARNPRIGGRGRAVFGILLGLIGLAGNVAMLVMVVSLVVQLNKEIPKKTALVGAAATTAVGPSR